MWQERKPTNHIVTLMLAFLNHGLKQTLKILVSHLGPALGGTTDRYNT